MRYLALLLVAAGLCAAQPVVYPYRWVFVSKGLGSDKDVEDIREIARVASEHGLNGMVLSTGLDRLDLQPPAFFDRMARVKQILDDAGLELIPQVFSAGYGSAVLAHNRNLAEGLPVKDAPLAVSGGVGKLEPDPSLVFVNPGFEDYTGNTAKGWRFHDRPGEVSFIDTQVFHSGAASLRFEGFEKFEYGNARAMEEIAVRPYRCYRVRAWVKTENLGSAFRMQVLTTSGRALAPVDLGVPATSDWRQVTVGFNSTGEQIARIYAGVWGGTGGRFWIDDFSIEEVAFTNIVRRPGTPLVVRSDDRDATFEEGTDFVPVRDPTLTFRFDHEGPRLALTPGSRIRDGERLRASWYHGVSINDGQVTICMSEPELYDIWAKQARMMHDLLASRHYLLSMDEIRAGGTDEACRRRNLPMAEILGDCITRQYQMLKDVNPDAEVLIWSDMLDPNHNAHGNYYLVEGDYTGSWEYVPKDLVIMCWYFPKRAASLAHFSGNGFRTAAGAYYDGDTLDNPRGWLEALDATPGAIGIMYTTWQNKYGLLADFGDLVSQRGGAAPTGRTSPRSSRPSSPAAPARRPPSSRSSR